MPAAIRLVKILKDSQAPTGCTQAWLAFFHWMHLVGHSPVTCTLTLSLDEVIQHINLVPKVWDSFFSQDDLPLHGCGWQSFHVTYATEQTHEAPSNPLKAQESWCCFAAFNSTWTSPLPLKRKVNLKIVINLIKSSDLKVWGQIRWYYLGLVHQPGVFQVPFGHSLQFHSVQVRFKGMLRTFLTIDLKPWSFLRSKKSETAGFGEKKTGKEKAHPPGN